MRSLLLGTIFLVSGASIHAQFANNAIGLRFSTNDDIESVAVEVSYQYGLSTTNRLEANLGFSSSSVLDLFRVAGFYQWVWPLEQGFNWYAGAGGGVGVIDYDQLGLVREAESAVFLILGGQVGIEYGFEDIPLQLSVDLRPEIYVGNVTDNLDIDLGVSVRYQF